MKLPDVQDTICALSTPSGVGALALIRLSGNKSFDILEKISSFNDVSQMKSHTAHFGTIRKENEIIDEVVAVVFKGPNSFTGEDTVEISCHGSDYIQRELFALMLKHGARLASPGEYTMRAYLNGKMDLSQAEAVSDLIASESKASHEVAMKQMRGGFSDEIKEFRAKLIDFASLIELELDFGEEDVEFADRTQLLQLIEDLQKKTKVLLESFSTGNAIKNGVPVAIIGEPNAGKSTLLNALLNEDKAIVSDIAGTTRDSIEDTIDINGILFRFVDTAGIRETEDTIENLGIDRSVKKAKEAQIVILLIDLSTSSIDQIMSTIKGLTDKTASEGQQFITILNKVDAINNLEGITSALPEDQIVIAISAKEKTNIELLKSHLSELVKAKMRTGNDTMVTNLRHYQVLQKVDQSLAEVKAGLNSSLSGDLLAIDIRKSLFHLGEVTGETTTDDLLGNIFSRFCIGK